jgi:adenylate cyclase
VALEMLREAFDLLLLDIEMPEMDGFQVLEQSKADLQLRDLPVIVTSALEGLANVVRCIELGAEDYLTKPVNPVLLKARIGASLEKKRLRDQQKELVRRFATGGRAGPGRARASRSAAGMCMATVMFSDIRGFTALVEQQPPDETIELLNTYYTLMFDAITRPGRRGQPDDRRRADGDLRRPAATGRSRGGGGACRRWTCWRWSSCSTPSAPRLEAHTKACGEAVLVDAATQAALQSRVTTRALGPVALKGKAAAVQVFAVGTGPVAV